MSRLSQPPFSAAPDAQVLVRGPRQCKASAASARPLPLRVEFDDTGHGRVFSLRRSPCQGCVNGASQATYSRDASKIGAWHKRLCTFRRHGRRSIRSRMHLVPRASHMKSMLRQEPGYVKSGTGWNQWKRHTECALSAAPRIIKNVEPA